MKNEFNDEILDITDTSLELTTEMLDFENDIKVSNEIDEMLDFIDLEPKNDDLTVELSLDDILENISETKEPKVEIEANKELEEYKPSIRDFNIKSAKTRKIVYKGMLYVIIVMLLGFEFFLTKSGEFLNEIRVYASDYNPIRIVQNEKVGFIDYTGNMLVNPKYSYAEDFVKGYAIAKDSSGLPLILDRGGKEIAPTGTYFSIYRAKEDIVAAKVTKDGLKYGILDSYLKNKTKFNYDLINFVDGIFTYVKGNEVGILNTEGKEIYKTKLTKKDVKAINVSVSELTDNNKDNIQYGVVTVNSSSVIVNLVDGKVVTNPTLNTITALEDNVFSQKNQYGNTSYLYVYNNEVIMQRDDVLSIKVPSIKSGVINTLKDDYTNEYISVNSKEQINKNITKNTSYYGKNTFVYLNHNYSNNKSELVFIEEGKIKESISTDYLIERTFENGIAIVKFTDGKLGYLNEQGKLITDLRFEEASSFDSYGETICKTNNGYGVINKEGKIIIPFENKNIIMADAKVKNESDKEENIFYAVKKDDKYILYNSKGKKRLKESFDNVEFSKDKPIVKVANEKYDMLLVSDSLVKINLTSFNTKYKGYDNYILIENNFYNYNGKEIYTDKSKK